LITDIKIPFKLESGSVRKDDTVVHEAIREALANALIHGDYRGQGGIVIDKHKDRLEFSNPGMLLVGLDQLLVGGVSECRNKLLQQMFSHVGFGERAGSGIDKIRRGWASQKWRSPSIQESSRPDRVLLILPMTSFLPDESLQRLRAHFGRRLDGLTALESQTLVTAEIEGKVSNTRLQEVCRDHPADLTRTLQGLVANQFLEQEGRGRWCIYRLPKGARRRDLRRSLFDDGNDAGTTANAVGSGLNTVGFNPNEVGSNANEVGFKPDESTGDKTLHEIAQPARKSARLPPEQIEALILTLCRDRFLTATRLAQLLNRGPKTTRRYLAPLVKRKAVRMKYPNPSDPGQAYTTVE
jgi:ATP-dependent DNA helicase RecG